MAANQNGSTADGSRHDAPGIAVIIATYNRSHLIGETLDSILAQTRPADELIVVHNALTIEGRLRAVHLLADAYAPSTAPS